MTSAMLKANARELIKANAPKLFFVAAIYLIIITFLSELQFRLPAPINIYEELRTGIITIQQFSDSIRSNGLLLALLLEIMSPTITIGFKAYCLKTVRKQEADYKDLLTGFSIFLKVISLSIITSILITLWSFLFFFPGIAAYYRYRLAYYILLDDPSKSVMKCISESKHLMRGKKVELFLIDLSFFPWNILNILVLSYIIPIFPIVSIWLTPYYGLSQATYYENIIKQVAV